MISFRNSIRRSCTAAEFQTSVLHSAAILLCWSGAQPLRRRSPTGKFILNHSARGDGNIVSNGPLLSVFLPRRVIRETASTSFSMPTLSTAHSSYRPFCRQGRIKRDNQTEFSYTVTVKARSDSFVLFNILLRSIIPSDYSGPFAFLLH